MVDIGFSGLLALILLAFVHLFANQSKVSGRLWHGSFLSFAAGVSFSYVFIDLLPKLEKSQPTIESAIGLIIPYLDHHSYLIALLGVLFYYGLHTKSKSGKERSYWLFLSGYLLFNLFVGASLSNTNNPDIQPLFLFTIGMSMHYFVRDHNASIDAPQLFVKETRFLLVIALIIGYLIGKFTSIPEAFIAICISFISGGILLNVMRYELPKREQVGYLFFLSGSLIYTIILLSVGKVSN
ncbi:hypothetical protein N9Y92_02405 [Chlamydiales bacterium]|nr:hypothetical protein [Chlamydiales bacterium]